MPHVRILSGYRSRGTESNRSFGISPTGRVLSVEERRESEEGMEVKRSLSAALAALLTVAGGVFAYDARTQMDKIDAALARGPQIAGYEIAEVMRLRKRGEQLHLAGEHAESDKVLRQAMEILGIK